MQDVVTVLSLRGRVVKRERRRFFSLKAGTGMESKPGDHVSKEWQIVKKKKSG
jgi:hypothetical protein